MAALKDRSNLKQIGLGQSPTDPGVADGVLQCGFTNVPVIEYVTWTVNVPMLDTEVSSTFGDEIDVLTGPKSVIGVDSVDSSFVLNGVLQADMLAYGFGFHIFGEPMSFMQIGNALSPAPAAATNSVVSPDVFTANDVQLLGLPSGSTLLPAIFKWGHDDWNAAWHLANAYQFQWKLYQRILLINELCADLCYFGPYAEASAAGTSEADVLEYARVANNRYRSKAGTSTAIFNPVNARRIGSVNSAAGVAPPAGVGTATTGNTGIFHPTRDFDLAPVTYGGIRNQGGAACCNPFRKLPRPVLLEKGLPIGMIMVVQDAYHQAQMSRHLSISESIGGTIATVTFDSNDTGISVLPTAATAFMPELTMDQGANQFSGQRVTTSRTFIKGGTLKVATLIKGLEVWGPWKNYIMQNLNSYVQVPSVSGGPGMSGLPALR